MSSIGTILDSFPPDEYVRYLNSNPRVREWVNNNKYMHPSMNAFSKRNIALTNNEQFLRNPTDVNVRGGFGNEPVPSFMQAQNQALKDKANAQILSPVMPNTTSNIPGGPTIDNLGLSNSFKIPLQHTPTDRATFGTNSFVSGNPMANVIRATNRPIPTAGTTGSFTSGAGTAMTQETANQLAQKASEEAVKKSIESSGSSFFGGPQAMLANMALSAIPTRDKERVSTPLGDKGSVSGYLKGAGQGALTGASIGSSILPGKGTAIGAVIGGTAGLLGAGSGMFDTRSAPRITQIGLLRGRGNLRTPKGIYG